MTSNIKVTNYNLVDEQITKKLIQCNLKCWIVEKDQSL